MSVQEIATILDTIFATLDATGFRVTPEVVDGGFSTMADAALKRVVPGTDPGLITDRLKMKRR